MPKYKKTNKAVTEGFIEKIFTSIGKGLRSGVLKQLASKDPGLAKDIKALEKARKDIDKRVKNLSPDVVKAVKAGNYFT